MHTTQQQTSIHLIHNILAFVIITLRMNLYEASKMFTMYKSIVYFITSTENDLLRYAIIRLARKSDQGMIFDFLGCLLAKTK